jgi:hypothetical protein
MDTNCLRAEKQKTPRFLVLGFCMVNYLQINYTKPPAMCKASPVSLNGRILACQQSGIDIW